MDNLFGEDEEKNKILADIKKGIHQGKTPLELKNELDRLLRNIEKSKIAKLQQLLISEGMAPEDVYDFFGAYFKSESKEE